MSQVNNNRLKKQLGIGVLLAIYVVALAYLSHYIV